MFLYSFHHGFVRSETHVQIGFTMTPPPAFLLTYFFSVSLPCCFLLTVLTLRSAKYTHRSDNLVASQDTESTSIKVQRQHTRGGRGASLERFVFEASPPPLPLPVNSQTMTSQLTCIISLRGSSFK